MKKKSNQHHHSLKLLYAFWTPFCTVNIGSLMNFWYVLSMSIFQFCSSSRATWPRLLIMLHSIYSSEGKSLHLLCDSFTIVVTLYKLSHIKIFRLGICYWGILCTCLKSITVTRNTILCPKQSHHHHIIKVLCTL